MSILKRLLTLGKAEGNALVSRLEDPIKMIDQGILDLRNDLNSSMRSLAEVKAALIRSQRDLAQAKQRAADYQEKAKRILQRAQTGELAQAEADRLATEALRLAQQDSENATRLQADVTQQEQLVNTLQGKINTLKGQITRFENEAKSLKARQKTAQSVKKINKQLANVDSGSTLAMLERMKARVDEEEALAQAYGDMAATGASLADEIDRAALPATDASVEDELARLKASL